MNSSELRDWIAKSRTAARQKEDEERAAIRPRIHSHLLIQLTNPLKAVDHVALDLKEAIATAPMQSSWQLDPFMRPQYVDLFAIANATGPHKTWPHDRIERIVIDLLRDILKEYIAAFPSVTVGLNRVTDGVKHISLVVHADSPDDLLCLG
jgi:hypothetical protein